MDLCPGEHLPSRYHHVRPSSGYYVPSSDELLASPDGRPIFAHFGLRRGLVRPILLESLAEDVHVSQDDPISEIRRHLLSVQAIAALGAELRLRQERREGDPVLRPRLQDAARAMHPALPDGLGPVQEELMLAAIGYALSEAAALFADPAQAPGWRHQDPVLINSIGRTSRKIVHDLEAASADRPELKAALWREGGAFLDVGTGAAWLAIEAARVWPALRVVGIDIHEPALALARKNVAELGLEARVELRRQDVTSAGGCGSLHPGLAALAVPA